jgi:hypothetical protein
MYTDRKTTTAYTTSQVAYPVGMNEDSYTIASWYREDLITGVITVEHELIKNHSYNTKREGMDKSSKYKETLHKGTYNECAKLVDDIVLKEGEWRQVPVKPFEKELLFTLNK